MTKEMTSPQNQENNPAPEPQDQPTIDPSQVIIIEPVLIKENLEIPIEKREQVNEKNDQ